MNDKLELIARAVIIRGDKILICKIRDKGHYCLPGGHIEVGEKAAEAVRREIKEELGVEIKKLDFIGTVENIFNDGEDHHEINIVFEASIDTNRYESKEDHIEFELFDPEKFSKSAILPLNLKNAVLKWIKDRKIFWAETD